jgi:sortase (surface protein transpeptidase)
MAVPSLELLAIIIPAIFITSYMQKDKFKSLKNLLSFYKIFGFIFILVGLIFLLVPVIPSILYSLDESATEVEASTITEQTKDSEEDLETVVEETAEDEAPDLPPFDSKLPTTNTIIINKIGVNGKIHEGRNAKAELEKGFWLTYGWGTPEDKLPIIIAAHRFGYVYWTNDFRKTQSFYNLPQVSQGDEIEIVWNQRKYKYRVYKSIEDTKIEDYDADLILYTCKLFKSPVRIFRYATRIN